MCHVSDLDSLLEGYEAEISIIEQKLLTLDMFDLNDDTFELLAARLTKLETLVSMLK
jgi:hypothetical protein